MAEVAGEAEVSPVHVFDEEPGHSVLNMFDIGTVLGAGSFGQVHRALHRDTGDEVALKLIPKSDSELGLRAKFGDGLLRRALFEMRHENIIRFLTFGEDAECSYVAMDLLTGPDLSDYFGEHLPLPASQAAAVMAQASAAISFLHAHDALHRDVKPDNFKFASPALETLKLIDFGSLVLSGTRLNGAEAAGSIGFCAPEALRGDCLPESDVFSLGVMLAIALTGAWPAPMRPELWQPAEEQDDPSAFELYEQGLQGLDEPGALARWVAQAVPGKEALRALLVKMLEPSPKSRSIGAADAESALLLSARA
jgi:serine/threonine protein kinase